MRTLSTQRWLHSLRSRILLLAVLACLLLAAALTGFFLLLGNTESAVVSDSASRLDTVAEEMVKSYQARAAQATSLDAANRFGSDDVLSSISDTVLHREFGVEGGFYSATSNDLLGYAFPSHIGPGPPKRDIPPVERPTITAIAEKAVLTGKPVSTVFRGDRDAILFHAMPIQIAGRTVGSAWVMKRIPGINSGRSLRTLLGVSSLGLAAMACVAIAFWITRGVQSDVLAIQNRLAAMGEDLSTLPKDTVATRELEGIMRGIDQLGKSLRQKITSERALQEKLHHQDRLAALGQVAAGVAHELRNPLATIRLRAQMAARTHDTTQIEKSSALIIEETERLSGMLERLLYFSKPIQLHSSEFDSCAFCQEIVQSFQPQAEAIDVHLIWVDSSSPVMVQADPFKLRQVLENLIHNSIESFEGTETTEKIVTVSVQSRGDKVQINIADNGPGLPADHVERIFDPFFTTKPTGTGLGLAIAKEIVSAHHGELRLEKQSAGGTLAVLILPLASTTMKTTDNPLSGKG